MSGKENLPQGKPTSSTGVSNIRPRRERPCDACRRRKSRCVIHEGQLLCVLCEFHKQECTFVQDPQPRKRKVTGDADKQKDGGSPKKRSVDPIVTPKLPPQKAPNSRPVFCSPHRGPTARVEDHVLGETLGLQRSRHSRYIGLTSPFDPVLVSLSQFDARGESILSVGTLRKVNEQETFIMVSDDESNDYGTDHEAINEIARIVGPHGSALVDLYFKVVHPSFPIVQKHVFLERFRTSLHNVSPPLLAGMYILALNWWSHDPNLASKPRPDIHQLESIASRTLTAAMQRPKLSTVQAGLLMLQRPEADSWSLTTQLVAIGQELGLHLDSSAWSIPLWERGIRKRIAWALYMQDKWSSLIHGRPSHIFAANWAVKAMSDADVTEDSQVNPNFANESDEEKEDIEQGLLLFTQMINLTSIMAEIMDTFYTQAAISDFANAGKNSTRLILERAKPVQIKLKDWFAKLPTALRMDNVTAKKLSSSGFLHLAYFATEITLHRRIVQSLSDSASDPYLSYICRSAAKTRLISAMDFVNRLRPEHLQAFWYFPSKINFTLIGTFGGLLWATAPAKEEAEFYRMRLREYRWTLSVSSERAEFLEYAVQMLDTSRSMLKNLAEKPALAQTQVSSAGVPDRSAMTRSSPSSVSTQRAMMHHMEFKDEEMGDAPPQGMSSSLSRVTSTSAFSGFSNDAMDISTNDGSASGRKSPIDTPPSSVA